MIGDTGGYLRNTRWHQEAEQGVGITTRSVGNKIVRISVVLIEIKAQMISEVKLMGRARIDRRINKALAGFTTAVTALTSACEELQVEKNGLLRLNDQREEQITAIRVAQDATTQDAANCQADSDRLTRVAGKIGALLE